MRIYEHSPFSYFVSLLPLRGGRSTYFGGIPSVFLGGISSHISYFLSIAVVYLEHFDSGDFGAIRPISRLFRAFRVYSEPNGPPYSE